MHTPTLHISSFDLIADLTLFCLPVTMLWDLNEGKHLYSLEAGDVINSLCFSPNRYWLCAATSTCIKIFDLESKSIVDELKPESVNPGAKGVAPECISLAWSADGQTLWVLSFCSPLSSRSAFADSPPFSQGSAVTPTTSSAATSSWPKCAKLTLVSRLLQKVDYTACNRWIFKC